MVAGKRAVGWLAAVALFSSPAVLLSMAWADDASFTAKKACNAYQSFRRQTNPGKVRVAPEKTYKINEVSKHADWYRIQLNGANPPDRWVYFECGEASGAPASTPSHEDTEKKGGCHTAGLADSYVLALSWQPAFCEGHPGKPECKVNDAKAYQAENFTLHGLWPNKKSCGTGYGFCGQQQTEIRPFCNYDVISVDDATDKDLDRVMPSAAHNSCLERHEWHKHGTCQTTWNEDGYFDTAIRLAEEFNKGGMSVLMSKNIGKSMASADFRKAIDENFGAGASDRVQIKCSGKMLVDVYINLPAELPSAASLKELIGKGSASGFKNTCGTVFKVDPIGQ